MTILTILYLYTNWQQKKMELVNSEVDTFANGESDNDLDSDLELIKEGSARVKMKQVLQRCSKKDEPSGTNEMKKEINLFSGTAYIVGGMIGSGIFITPNRILALTHSFGLTLIVWVVGSIMAT